MKDINWVENEIKWEIKRYKHRGLRNKMGTIIDGLQIALNIIEEGKK